MCAYQNDLEMYKYFGQAREKLTIICKQNIEKISKFGKTHQELTLDTVKKFLKDSRDSNFKI